MVNFGLKKIAKVFSNHSCGVFGEKGSGKDMLMSNVAFFRKIPYASNLSYGGKFIPLSSDFREMRLSGTTFKSMVNGDVRYYEYPFVDGTDVYISDAGCYFPSQYNETLNKLYPEIPLFMALSRHLGNAGVHYNVQSLSRVWLIMREQCERFIWCVRCVKIGHIIIQRCIVYDNIDTAQRKVRPFNLPKPFVFNSKGRFLYEVEKARYEQNYGVVTPYTLIYFHRSNYDTRHFKEVFANGKKS